MEYIVNDLGLINDQSCLRKFLLIDLTSQNYGTWSKAKEAV